MINESRKFIIYVPPLSIKNKGCELIFLRISLRRSTQNNKRKGKLIEIKQAEVEKVTLNASILKQES